MERIKTYLELCKLKISLLTVFSALAGFLIVSSGLGIRIVVMAAGVFSLSCGSCALNQYQDRDIDALMGRTKKRPIPSSRIVPIFALYFSIILIAIGAFALYSAGGFRSSVPGLCAMVWYNGVYTYLKRKSAFAVIPGALVGAVPPAIGWVTGGGMHINIGISALCFFCFMWQIPHFWLLLLHYGDDYKKAGLPSLAGVFTGAQLERIIRQWIFAVSLSCLFITLRGITFPVLKIAILALSCGLVYTGISFLRGSEYNRGLIFTRINMYMTTVLFFIMIDKLVRIGIPVKILQAFV